MWCCQLSWYSYWRWATFDKFAPGSSIQHCAMPCLNLSLLKTERQKKQLQKTVIWTSWNEYHLNLQCKAFLLILGCDYRKGPVHTGDKSIFHTVEFVEFNKVDQMSNRRLTFSDILGMKIACFRHHLLSTPPPRALTGRSHRNRS